MRESILAALVAVLWGLSPAVAATVLVGNHELQPNQANQPIEIYVIGGEAVWGGALSAVIGDGGSQWGGAQDGPRFIAPPDPPPPPPENPPPRFHPEMIAGSIWDGDNDGGTYMPNAGTPGDWRYEASQIQTGYISSTLGPTTLGTAGEAALLLTFFVDTTGFSAGTWNLYLSDVPSTFLPSPYAEQWQATFFVDDPAQGGRLSPTVNDGTISIVGVLTSVNGGNWNAAGTWDGTTPPTVDYDTVVANHEVEVAANGAANTLTINDPAGKVAIDANRTLAISRNVDVSGTLEIAPAGRLNVGTDLVLLAGSTYTCQLGAADFGLIDASGDVNVTGGTLVLEATAGLPAVGSRTLTIVSAAGASGVTGPFAATPAADSHLGRGVFFRSMDHGDASAAKVNVFQAIAGDADGDRLFNFGDLIAIFSQSGQYYGNPSITHRSWTNGDFTGEGSFTFSDLIVAFGAAGQYYGSASPYAAATLPAAEEGSVSLIYDPSTGRLVLDTGGMELTTLSIESASGLLQVSREAEGLLDGFADVMRADRFGKLDISGMGDLDFGIALAAMLSEGELRADLTVTGSRLGGGAIEDVKLVVSQVPEPGALLILLSGLATWLLWRRSRR